MIVDWLRDKITVSSRSRQELEEHEKIARLEKAEEDLASLRERSETALMELSAREKRNHWRESIEQMIHGVI